MKPSVLLNPALRLCVRKWPTHQMSRDAVKITRKYRKFASAAGSAWKLAARGLAAGCQSQHDLDGAFPGMRLCGG